ncbi:MAG: MaoC/PaaZ C-terminal domain-containing protein [Fastidiosipilaceae bacterium]|jgi:acyl dehydratase|nr:acyl dehydratase [Clostridiaceae bacterium]
MYLEDYIIGKTYPLEETSFTEEEIIKFAKEFDPRPIHLDKEAAKDLFFGDIIASGLHTAVKCWSVWVKTFNDAEGMIAGIGIDNLRWHQPVFPGDKLRGTITIQDVSPREGRPNGVVTYHLNVINQHDKDVMSFTAKALVKRRD